MWRVGECRKAAQRLSSLAAPMKVPRQRRRRSRGQVKRFVRNHISFNQ